MSKFFQRRDLDKTFFKVLFSMLMVFVLLISVASPSYAVVGVTSILIPSVIAALESWGISTAADGLDGDEIAEWFHEKLTSWETAAQISLANIVTGIKMTPIGQVLLNPIALAGIREFAVWLIQDEGLVAGGSSVPVITGDTAFRIPVGQSTRVVTDSSGKYYVITPIDEPIAVFAIPFSSSHPELFQCVAVGVTRNSRVHVVLYNANGSVNLDKGNFSLNQSYSNGLLYWVNIASGATLNASIPWFATRNEGLASLLTPSSDGTMDLVPGSGMAVPSASDIQDKEMLINTSLDVGADAAAWYEQVMNKVAANDMTATGTLVGAGTITADQVIDQGAITEQEGVVSWPDVTVPIGVSGLDEIFPFCIPFDIYHFFEALAADPVAPSFEIPFVIDGLVDYTFEIDLEPFDQVAQVLRLVELLAFCVGLAFVTRSMFIRG